MKNKSFLSRAWEGSKMVRERIGYGTGLPGKWKVLASVMLLLTMGIGQVWGADYTFAAGTFASDKLTATVDNQTFTFSLAHGGAGSNKYAGGTGDSYIKISAGKTVTITFPDGFVASNLNIKGYTNKDSGTNTEISEVAGTSQSEKTFPLRNTNNISEYDFSISSTATSITFKTKASTEQGCLLITITGTPPACTAPEIAWSVEPTGGAVGGSATASVTTTPASQTVTWTSSNTSVATVDGGAISFVAPGIAKISAEFTYSGSDYCEQKASISKDILVPIDAITPDENDKVWYYTTDVPSSSPDNGLNYGATKTGNGLNGVKLNSDGYAWFTKPNVSGKLRIGAYWSSASTSVYDVYVYACNASGEKSGNPLDSLSIATVGGVSTQIDIANNVAGLRIERKTKNEGVLYFIEFEGDAPTCTTPTKDATFTATSSAIEIAYGDENASTTLTFTKGDNTSNPTYVVTKGGSATNDATVSSGTFTATAAGTYVVTATQAEDDTYCEVVKQVTITVTEGEAPVCPSGLSINGTTAYTEGQTISLTATLAAGNGTITYTWYKGADLATAKSAGSIGTGTSFSKTSCTTSDAGNYWCEATMDACSAASNASAYAVTVAEDACPKSGVVYSLVVKSAVYSVPKQTETNMVSDYATVTGGEAYIGNSHTADAGKAQVMTTGGGTVYFGGNNGYIKVVLDCDMQANDVINFDNGSGSNQISFTTADTRATTPATSSNTWTVTSEFATAVNSNSNTFYIWRASGSATYLHSLTITRPYNVSFVSAHGTAPTTPTKAITLTLEKIADVEGWKHSGWTANTTVNVGGEDKTAGTALAVDATVTVSANTVFTAVWKDASALSVNAYLSSLSVAGYALDFNKETTSYTVVLDYGTTTLPEITYEVEDTGLATAEKVEGGVNGATTITVTPEAGAGHEKDYTINFSVNTSPKFVIYDGSTMTNITSATYSDESTGFSYSMASSISLEGITFAGSWNGKNYTKAIKGFKPTENANNIVSFVIPEGYLAKVRLVGTTNSDGKERKMFIALKASQNADDALNDYVLTSSTLDAVGLVTDMLLPGTYYLGSTEGYRLFEFSVQLYSIDYSRNVTAGNYGTICLPNSGVMVGGSIYEVAYLDNSDPYRKIFFDEVVSGEMVAGRPYIFLPDEGVNAIAVLYTGDEGASAGNYRGLYGFIDDTEGAYYSVPDGANNYIIYGNQYHYVQTGADARILSNRAYLKIGEDGVPTNSVAPAPGRRRVSMSGQGEQVATGTEEAQTDNIQCAKIVIDGQFFILRGEKMYDATGRLVK